MAARAPIERLPDDLLQNAFERLRPADLAAVRQTSSRMRAAARGVRWASIDVKSIDEGRVTVSRNLFFHTGFQLNATVGTGSLASALESGAVSSLERLAVGGSGSLANLQILHAVSAAGLRPREIVLSVRAASDLVAAAAVVGGAASRARRVKIAVEDPFGDLGSLSVVLRNAFPATKSLSFAANGRTTRQTQSAVAAVLRAFPALEELELKVLGAALTDLSPLEALPRLQSLELRGRALKWAFPERPGAALEHVAILASMFLPEDDALVEAVLRLPRRRSCAFLYIDLDLASVDVHRLVRLGPVTVGDTLDVHASRAFGPEDAGRLRAFARWLGEISFDSMWVDNPLRMRGFVVQCALSADALETLIRAFPRVRPYAFRYARTTPIGFDRAARELAALAGIEDGHTLRIEVAYAIGDAEPERAVGALRACDIFVDYERRRPFLDLRLFVTCERNLLTRVEALLRAAFQPLAEAGVRTWACAPEEP